MKLTFTFLIALASLAWSQTYRTVTADTNNAIRTNFTILSSQVVGGGAGGSVDLSSTNVIGVLPIAKGGTGETNAANAIEAFLPSYTGNSNKVLSLNTNATALEWVEQSGGGGTTYTNSEDAMLGLFFASTNDNGINLFANGGTNANSQHVVIGSGASAYGTSNVWEAVVIGAVAEVTNGGVAVGSYAVTENGIALGPNATSDGSSVAVGRYADAQGGTVSTATNAGSVAVGTFATAFPYQGVAVGSSSQTEGRGIAIGFSALSESNSTGFGGTAVGYNADALGGGAAYGDNAIATDGVSIGYGASSSGESISIGAQAYDGGTATNAIQIGRGTNTNNNTIQFFNAGSVTTDEWTALANSTTFGRYFFVAPTNGTSGQILALNGDATGVVWTNNGSGGTTTVDLSSTNATGVLPIAKGGTGATDAGGALTNLGVLLSAGVNIGGTANVASSVVIGSGAVGNGGIGTLGGVVIGRNASSTNSGIAIGYAAFANGLGAAIGYQAENTSDGASVGYQARATNSGDVALGRTATASASGAIQLGSGVNSTASTIQFRSAGTIDTDEWARIAALSTYPTTNISVVGTNNTNTLVFSNGILVNVTTP